MFALLRPTVATGWTSIRSGAPRPGRRRAPPEAPTPSAMSASADLLRAPRPSGERSEGGRDRLPALTTALAHQGASRRRSPSSIGPSAQSSAPAYCATVVKTACSSRPRVEVTCPATSPPFRAEEAPPGDASTADCDHPQNRLRGMSLAATLMARAGGALSSKSVLPAVAHAT